MTNDRHRPETSTPTPPRSRRSFAGRVAVLAALVVVILGAVACDGSGGDDMGATFDSSDTPSKVGSGDATDDLSAESGDGGSPVDLASARRADAREVIYTAYMEVGAVDVERAARRAHDVVAEAGGYLFSASEQGLDDEHPSVTLTFKVPPDSYETVLDSFGELGRVAERRVDTEDVTGQVVDLDARLDAATTSADRLRELLAETGNVGDLLNVERELAAREAQVESLTGQLAALREQIDLATITLHVVKPSETTPAVSDDIPGFIEGAKTGTAAFVNVLLVIATAVGFSLPFLALAVVVGGPILLVVRRRRAERRAE